MRFLSVCECGWVGLLSVCEGGLMRACARACVCVCVCVHLCMHKVTRDTQVKGTKRMKTQLALRIHEDVAVRHERLRLHADACRESAVRLAGCLCVCVCVCV